MSKIVSFLKDESALARSNALILALVGIAM